MSEEKPREFFIVDDGNWSLCAYTTARKVELDRNGVVIQVVERSAYDALAERLRECEAALGFSGNRAIEYFEKWGNK